MRKGSELGTKVLGLRSSMLSELPIPLARGRTVAHVAELIRTAVVSREAYAESLLKARSIIEALPAHRVANEMCLDVRPRAISYSGRTFPTLSAWNYAATGGALEYLRGHWRCRLRDLVDSSRLAYGPRFASVPCIPPFGTDFWSQRDIFLIRPVPRRIKDPGIPGLRIPEDAILISGCGQLQEGNLFGRGRTSCVGASAGLVTGHSIPLIPSPGHSAWLYAFLSTRLGLRLLRACAIGTSVPAMHLGLLSDLPIPELGSQDLAALRLHMKAAIDARIRASAAENNAIRIVEEEVLPEWLS